MLASLEADDPWKLNDKTRATARCVLDPGSAVVKPHELADNRQSDSAASCRRFGRAGKTNVWIPDFFALAFWNARTLVFDCDDHFVVRRRQGNLHSLT